MQDSDLYTSDRRGAGHTDVTPPHGLTIKLIAKNIVPLYQKHIGKIIYNTYCRSRFTISCVEYLPPPNVRRAYNVIVKNDLQSLIAL